MTPTDYVPFTAETLPARLSGVTAVTGRLGGDTWAWQVREVGDGNLNLSSSSKARKARWWSSRRCLTSGWWARALYDDRGDVIGSDQALHRLLSRIWADTMGFCGEEMHRRILGLAHIEDLERIADEGRRVVAERRALALGRHLAVNHETIPGMGAVLDLARRIEKEDLS